MVNIYIVPFYLEAKTKNELVKKMLQTNLRDSTAYKFSPPVKEGKVWVTWYETDIKELSRKQNKKVGVNNG